MNTSNSENVYYVIDKAECNQNNLCQLAAPDSIAIGGQGYPYFIKGTDMGEYSVLLNPPSSEESALLDAIASCPCGCITRETHIGKK
jgi:ferredoxin